MFDTFLSFNAYDSLSILLFFKYLSYIIFGLISYTVLKVLIYEAAQYIQIQKYAKYSSVGTYYHFIQGFLKYNLKSKSADAFEEISEL